VEIDPFVGEDSSLFLYTRLVSRTVEVERSVIRIDIAHDKKTHSIESEIPEKEGKGTRPILKPQQFLAIVSEPGFKSTIETFWKNWDDIGGDIRIGTAGFSAGLMIGDKRVAPFFTYYNRIPVLSDKWRSNYSIPDDLFAQYREALKASQTVYDGYCVGNRVEVPFSEISVADLETIYEAALDLGKKLLSSQDS